MKYKKYIINLSKSLEKYPALLVMPLDSNSAGLSREWLSEICSGTAKVQVFNYHNDWLSLRNGQFAKIPNWAYYFNDNLIIEGKEKYILKSTLLSLEFKDYWRSSTIDVKDSEGKFIKSLRFGFLGFSVEVSSLNFVRTRNNTPFVCPINGIPFSSKADKKARIFLSRKTEKRMLNIVLSQEEYYVNGHFKVVLKFLEKLYPENWLAEHENDVCIENYKE